MKKTKESQAPKKKHKGLKITLLVIAIVLVVTIAGGVVFGVFG